MKEEEEELHLSSLSSNTGERNTRANKPTARGNTSEINISIGKQRTKHTQKKNEGRKSRTTTHARAQSFVVHDMCITPTVHIQPNPSCSWNWTKHAALVPVRWNSHTALVPVRWNSGGIQLNMTNIICHISWHRNAKMHRLVCSRIEKE